MEGTISKCGIFQVGHHATLVVDALRQHSVVVVQIYSLAPPLGSCIQRLVSDRNFFRCIEEIHVANSHGTLQRSRSQVLATLWRVLLTLSVWKGLPLWRTYWILCLGGSAFDVASDDSGFDVFPQKQNVAIATPFPSCVHVCWFRVFLRYRPVCVRRCTL